MSKQKKSAPTSFTSSEIISTDPKRKVNVSGGTMETEEGERKIVKGKRRTGEKTFIEDLLVFFPATEQKNVKDANPSYKAGDILSYYGNDENTKTIINIINRTKFYPISMEAQVIFAAFLAVLPKDNNGPYFCFLYFDFDQYYFINNDGEQGKKYLGVNFDNYKTTFQKYSRDISSLFSEKIPDSGFIEPSKTISINNSNTLDFTSLFNNGFYMGVQVVYNYEQYKQFLDTVLSDASKTKMKSYQQTLSEDFQKSMPFEQQTIDSTNKQKVFSIDSSLSERDGKIKELEAKLILLENKLKLSDTLTDEQLSAYRKEIERLTLEAQTYKEKAESSKSESEKVQSEDILKRLENMNKIIENILKAQRENDQMLSHLHSLSLETDTRWISGITNYLEMKSKASITLSCFKIYKNVGNIGELRGRLRNTIETCFNKKKDIEKEKIIKEKEKLIAINNRIRRDNTGLVHLSGVEKLESRINILGNQIKIREDYVQLFFDAFENMAVYHNPEINETGKSEVKDVSINDYKTYYEKRRILSKKYTSQNALLGISGWKLNLELKNYDFKEDNIIIQSFNSLKIPWPCDWIFYPAGLPFDKIKPNIEYTIFPQLPGVKDLVNEIEEKLKYKKRTEIFDIGIFSANVRTEINKLTETQKFGLKKDETFIKTVGHLLGQIKDHGEAYNPNDDGDLSEYNMFYEINENLLISPVLTSRYIIMEDLTDDDLSKKLDNKQGQIKGLIEQVMPKFYDNIKKIDDTKNFALNNFRKNVKNNEFPYIIYDIILEK